MKKGTITAKQQEIYDFVRRQLTATGESPTLAEIAQEIEGKSIRTVVQHLQALQRKGLITRSHYAQRGIKLVEDQKPQDEMIQVPVFASAGCGSPSVIAQRTYDEYIMVSPNMVGGFRDDLFVIRAIGTSMQDAGISDGDFVLVRRTEDVQTGDRIVAIVDGDAVIKRIVFADGAVLLNPDTKDSQHHPIVLKSGDLTIFGKVMQVIRIPKSSDYQIVPLGQEQDRA